MEVCLCDAKLAEGDRIATCNSRLWKRSFKTASVTTQCVVSARILVIFYLAVKDNKNKNKQAKNKKKTCRSDSFGNGQSGVKYISPDFFPFFCSLVFPYCHSGQVVNTPPWTPKPVHTNAGPGDLPPTIFMPT